MSIYEYALEDLQLELQGQVDGLNRQKVLAESSTTMDEFNSHKASWDALYATYNNTLDSYSIAKDDYARYINVQRASTEKIALPNPGDRLEWLAGGYLKNQTFAGGVLFDINQTPSFDNKVRKASKTVNMLNGNTLNDLNPSYHSTLQSATSGLFDIFNDFTIRDTIMLSYTLTIAYQNSGEILSFRTGTIYQNAGGNSHDGSSQSNVGGNIGTSNLASTQSAYNSSFNALGMLSTANPIEIGMTMVNLATGKQITMSSVIGGAVIGSIKSIATNLATKSVLGALGVTSIGVAMGISLAVGKVVGELMEMALGLDNSFGFGGELVGTDLGGINGAYSQPRGVIESIKNMLGIDTFNTGLVSDIHGGIIGFSAKPTSIEDMLGYDSYSPSTGLSSSFNTNLSYGIDLSAPTIESANINSPFSDAYSAGQINSGGGDTNSNGTNSDNDAQSASAASSDYGGEDADNPGW